MQISYILGIDQTGAVDAKGNPKRLFVSLCKLDKASYTMVPNLTIKNLHITEVTTLIKQYFPEFSTEHVLICVDSVLGLPKDCGVTVHDLLSKARDYKFKKKSFGANVAFQFYSTFAKSPYPSRQVETLVGANSVFQLMPYQRNIGCGSYRILKNLAENIEWFSIWPFEIPTKQFIIAEAYPSYFWKHTLGFKTRNLDSLKKRYPKYEFKSADFADGFVLALGASKNLDYIKNKDIFPSYVTMFEGWILGVPYAD
jgi:hypothetical protein